MKTKLCRLLNVEKPILSAPLGGVAGPKLIAAVSKAGGFGVIPLWGGTPQQVQDSINEVRQLTDRNFAVNLNLSSPYEEHLRVCIEKEIFAVSLFWGMEPAAIETAKKGGLLVFASVGSAKEAKMAADAGADVIVAQGWEAGGHVWGKVATMALIPAVVDAVSVPVIAAGGIADGRGMAAALMLGASGVWVGTRFLSSEEVEIHPDYRRQILAASEEQAEWYCDLYDVGWADAPHRALSNTTSQQWRASGSSESGSRPNEQEVIGHNPDGKPVLRYQSYSPKTETTGDVAAMSLWSGQGVALVQKTMPAADIVDEIYQEARHVIRSQAEMLDVSGD